MDHQTIASQLDELEFSKNGFRAWEPNRRVERKKRVLRATKTRRVDWKISF